MTSLAYIFGEFSRVKVSPVAYSNVAHNCFCVHFLHASATVSLSDAGLYQMGLAYGKSRLGRIFVAGEIFEQNKYFCIAL